MDFQRPNYLYLYDLPKDKISSVKIALAFDAEGIDIGDKKPNIRRDFFKPFYTAVLHFIDNKTFDTAKQKMKYFDIENFKCRSLPFDNRQSSKAQNKDELNLFFKLGKDEDKSILTYQYLDEKFSKYGNIASSKIALYNDGANKGFAYIQFEEKESVKKCVEELGGENGQVSIFKKSETPFNAEQSSNQIYFNFVPLSMEEAEVKPLFEKFGKVTMFFMNKSDKGKYGYVVFSDPASEDKEYGQKAMNACIAKMDGHELIVGTKMVVKKYIPKDVRSKQNAKSSYDARNALKRQNLYVSNFPKIWKESEIKQIFS
jgi:hypothetical protein